jgi:uncharacterized protein YcfL
MKKLFLVLLAAGLFVACGTKQTDETTAVDSTIVEDTVVAPEQAPVADATQPVAEPTDQKATTTNQKATTTVEKTATPASTTAAVKEEPKTATQPAAQEKTTPTKKRR